MFCIYCRTPFDENVATVCSGCGRELFKEETGSAEQTTESESAVEETLESENAFESEPQNENAFEAAAEVPKGLIHICGRCQSRSPVVCYYCNTPAEAGAIVYPEGYTVCSHCNQTFWLLCPHCTQQEQPEPEPQQEYRYISEGSPYAGGGYSQPYTPQGTYTPPTQTPGQTPGGGGGGGQTPRSTPQTGGYTPQGSQWTPKPGPEPIIREYNTQPEQTPQQAPQQTPQQAQQTQGKTPRTYPEPYKPSRFKRFIDLLNRKDEPEKKQGKPRFLRPRNLVAGGAIAGTILISFFVFGDSFGRGGHEASDFTPNASIPSNRMSMMRQYNRNGTHMFWAEKVYRFDNKTGESEIVVDLNPEIHVTFEAFEPYFFTGDYVYFRTEDSSRRETLATQRRLTRVNLNNGEIEVEDGDNEYTRVLCYDGTYIYALKATAVAENEFAYSLDKYDPDKFTVIESINIPESEVSNIYQDDVMVWQGKMYFMKHVSSYSDEYVAGEANDYYIYIDLETGAVNRLLSDRNMYAGMLCADKEALYFVVGGGNFQEESGDGVYKMEPGGQPELFFSYETVKDHYEHYNHDTVQQEGVNYYVGLNYAGFGGNYIYLDGDWMLIVIDVYEGNDSKLHYLRVKTDGSEIYRIDFADNRPRHTAGMAGGDKNGWIYENVWTWQFEDNAIIRHNEKEYDEPIPFEKLK